MKIELTYYLVTTSDWKWGRGKTLKDALMAANALNPKNKIRKGITVQAYKNTQTKKDVLTQKRLDAFLPYYDIKGYKAGEYLLPFINIYGQPVHYGKLEAIEGFDYI